MKKRALIIVDMLNDFVTGELENPEAQAIIPNIKALADKIRNEGGIVVYANDAHLPTDFEFDVWPLHALAGTRGADVIPELAPQKGDFIIPKRTYSAFFETGLDQLLRQNEVEEVIITGQHTNICDRHTAADAFFRRYPIVVPADCVAMFARKTKKETDKAQEEALEYLKMAYKAEIVDSWEDA